MSGLLPIEELIVNVRIFKGAGERWRGSLVVATDRESQMKKFVVLTVLVGAAGMFAESGSASNLSTAANAIGTSYESNVDQAHWRRYRHCHRYWTRWGTRIYCHGRRAPWRRW